MASFIFNSCWLSVWRGRIDIEGGRVKAMLVNENYQPDKYAHFSRSDVVEYEAKGDGYPVGGVAVGGHADMPEDALGVSIDAFKLDRATVTARYVVYYIDNGDPADDDLIGVSDFGENVTSTRAPYDVTESVFRVRSPK